MSASGSGPPSAASGGESRRLDSWKEIAAHLRRDVRTVRRWEKAEGLPVHRHAHGARDSVYAFSTELDAWWRRGEAALAASTRRRRERPSRALLAAAAALGVLAIALGALYAHLPKRIAAELARRPPDPRPVAGARPLAARAVDPAALAAYAKGRALLKRHQGKLPETRACFEEAIARDPRYAAAYAGLSTVFLRMAFFGKLTMREAWARAETAAQQAIALDDTIPDSHVALGTVRLHRDFDWLTARREILRAIALDPRDADARRAHAEYLRLSGDVAGAIAERTRARDAEPGRPELYVELGDDFVFARRYDDALAEYQAALELEPAYRRAVAGLADAYERKELFAEAARHRVRELTLRGEKDAADEFDRRARAEGYRAAAAWLDRRSIARLGSDPERNLWNLAFLSARVGDREAALSWLERALAQRDSGVLLARIDPDVDTLRGEPRFREVLRGLGTPPP